MRVHPPAPDPSSGLAGLIPAQASAPLQERLSELAATATVAARAPEPLEELLPPVRLSRRRLLAALGAAGAAGALAPATSAAAWVDAPWAAPRSSSAAGPAYATAGPRRVARVMWGATTTERVVALTFDDGPSRAVTSGFLDVLERSDVRATFFLVGERAVAQPDLVRRELAARHEIGNHSWTHADLGRVAPEVVREELERTHDALARLTGRPPTLLRPPYGHLSGQALAVAGELGYDVALWTIGLREKEFDPARNTAWVLEELRPGTALLAHDDAQAQRAVGLDALPGIIRGARERGYRFVTVSELMALDAGR